MYLDILSYPSTNLSTKPSNAQAKQANDNSNQQPCTLTFLVTHLLIYVLSHQMHKQKKRMMGAIDSHVP